MLRNRCQSGLTIRWVVNDRIIGVDEALGSSLPRCASPLAGCAGSGGKPYGRLIDGFSLIEMLVALVVLAMSLGVLYQAAMGATRNVRVAEEYIDAVMLAESMLADHSYVSEANYSAAGQFGQYDWQVNSWPAMMEDGLDPEQRGVAPQALQYLEVVVTWPGRNTPRSLDLVTVVPLREVAE